MLLEHLSACLLGVGSGFAIGIIPGVGPLVVMILSFTFLMKAKMSVALVFYCCMMSACQFGGSITALAAGLPGETNSFPLLKIRPELIRQGLQGHALFLCAAGHAIGAFSTFALTALLIDVIASNTAYLKSIVLIGFSLIGIVLCFMFSDNRWYVNLALFVCAWVLSRVGISHITREPFLTFDNIWLSGGLPTISVILGIYAIPAVVRSLLRPLAISANEFEFSSHIPDKLGLLMQHFSAIIRGNFIGFFSGIIPYIGVDICSYVAFYTERFFKRPILSQVISSETATNAAGISVLLPLLVYGIAIQPSEAVLLEAVNTSKDIVNWQSVEPIFGTIAFWLIVANAICFFLSWNLARPVISNLSNIGRWVPLLMAVLCVYTVLMVGVGFGQGTYYLIVLVVFGLLGWLLRNLDILPFIFGFTLQHSLESTLVKFWILYIQ